MPQEDKDRSTLIESVARLKDSEHLGVVITEEDRIVEANDAFLHMIGCSRQDLKRGVVDWQKITPPEYLLHSHKAVEQLRSNAASVPFEKEYVRPDGSRVPVLIAGVRLQREPLKWVCYIVDLSSRKAAAEAEERTRSLQEQGRLVNLLAHEINNPLTILANTLFLLNTNASLDTDGKQLVSQASEALKRIEESVRALLAAAADLPMAG